MTTQWAKIISLSIGSNRGSPSETTRFYLFEPESDTAPLSVFVLREEIGGFGESIMTRGVIWLLGALLLSGLLILR